MEAFHARVTLGVQGGVAEVCLTRPQQHNGLDWSMIEGLLSAQRRLVELTREGGGDIGAVVLSGEGESFCAGLDMKSIMSEPQRMPSLLEADEAGVNPVQRLALGWREAGVPVIAALQGHVYGGGLQIALGADIRVVSPDARLALLEIAWGLVPDMGISVTASHMRDDVLLELAWTGARSVVRKRRRWAWRPGLPRIPGPRRSRWPAQWLLGRRRRWRRHENSSPGRRLSPDVNGWRWKPSAARLDRGSGTVVRSPPF
ncbi:putative enoyl-CoA hydratase echA6 [Halomonas elongata]|uniref:Putative enoyl-CoA hydratase echA6 n=1 Tax=Halomonas elongata TaxID=2746 RepID=A0A1B8P5S2_HALEL|nr:putative enoyl-CoA hydratase echA6 [Halomonas elongata]